MAASSDELAAFSRGEPQLAIVRRKKSKQSLSFAPYRYKRKSFSRSR